MIETYRTIGALTVAQENEDEDEDEKRYDVEES